MGRLASFSLVSIICFFWTVPVSFVAGLSSVDALREEIEWIDNLIEAVPAFEPIFKILAPQLLIILNALLPVILRWVATFEGSISGSIVEASLFSKLAAFTIIQVRQMQNIERLSLLELITLTFFCFADILCHYTVWWHHGGTISVFIVSGCMSVSFHSSL